MVNLHWFQGFEGIEYLVIPVDTATLTEFTEQQESCVWSAAGAYREPALWHKGRNLGAI